MNFPTFDSLCNQLRISLEDPSKLKLRNERRARFSPSLSYGRHFGPPSSQARAAAVMVLIEPRDGRWTIPLTVRPQTLSEHPGQISFPGGRLEGDETHLQAAMREFGEELGVAPFPGQILGTLQPLYVFNSNYHVAAYVAVVREPLTYQPCLNEVERVIHLPLESLAHSLVTEQFQRGAIRWNALSIQYRTAENADRIWGATAILLGELSALLSELPDPSDPL